MLKLGAAVHGRRRALRVAHRLAGRRYHIPFDAHQLRLCLTGLTMSRGSFSDIRGRVPGSMDKGAVILDIGKIYTK